MQTVATGDAIELPARYAVTWTPRGQMPFDHIVKTTAEACGFTVTDLLSDRRDRKRSTARQIAMWLAWELTTLSKAQIGRLMGGRDHTTIIHGIRMIGWRMEVEPELRERVAGIKARLGAS